MQMYQDLFRIFQAFHCFLCVWSERNSSKAAGDQPTGHRRHLRGTFCPAGDWRSKLWHVRSFIFLDLMFIKMIWPDLLLDIIPVYSLSFRYFCSFLENLESRNKCSANGQSPSSGSQSPIIPPSGASTGSSSPSTPQPPVSSQVLPQSPSMPVCSVPPSSAAGTMTTSPAIESLPSAQSPEHLQASASVTQKRSFISRWFGSPPASDAPASAPGDIPNFNVKCPILQVSLTVKWMHLTYPWRY